ncbi:long-chain fatty acid transport protein 4-like protein [Cladochytrium replicatum]|nr:long-chain fatty acid transport protein 4-like protein [Cladochytrium replicatum]
MSDPYGIAHDIRTILLLTGFLKSTEKAVAQGKAGLIHKFIEQVEKAPHRDALVFGNDAWSYAELHAESNRNARWLMDQGIGPGDMVALMFPNCPDFLFWWLGLMKVGATGAFLNNNQRDKALIHSIKVAKPKMLLFHASLTEAVDEIKDEFSDLRLVISMPSPWTIELTAGEARVPPFAADSVDQAIALRNYSDAELPPEVLVRKDWNAVVALIYTSGTSGLPKAARMSSARFFSSSLGFSKVFQVRPTDRVYCCLPLYHSAASVCGFGVAWITGATMILAPKFSASQYFADCRRYNATAAQYIGELCRYLLASPRSPADNAHNVRMMYGNGLRPDIWIPFIKRFQIREIGEFYGSSEGPGTATLHRSTLDFSGKVVGTPFPGAVGKIGILFTRTTSKIVKVDPVTGDLRRGPDGFLIECKQGEPGELLGKTDPNGPIKTYLGYHGNSEASQKKVATDCFVKGDMFIRTGDVVKLDNYRFVYFVDRIGDTFRWKGENVSTLEVANALSKYKGVGEAVVYGVPIPGHDGKAGMALISPNADFDLKGLSAYAHKHLPKYAVPVFIRISSSVTTTSTFKHVKFDLEKEAFDPEKVSDSLYVLDTFMEGRSASKKDVGSYQPFGEKEYSRLVIAAQSKL